MRRSAGHPSEAGATVPVLNGHALTLARQPEFVLRMAVMDVGGKPLLAWARTNSAIPDTAFLADFEDMLASVDFK